MCGIGGGANIKLHRLFKMAVEQEMLGRRSVGVVWIDENGLKVVKMLTSPRKAYKKLTKLYHDSIVKVGIVHNRMPSVGAVNLVNCHPFKDCSGRIYLAHNGTFDRRRLLRLLKRRKGHKIMGDTDSEVLVHILEEKLEEIGDPDEAVKAFKESLDKLFSYYTIACLMEGSLYLISNKYVYCHRNGRRFMFSNCRAPFRPLNGVEEFCGIMKMRDDGVEVLVEEELEDFYDEEDDDDLEWDLVYKPVRVPRRGVVEWWLENV